MGVLKIEKSCESIKYLKENCGYLSDEFQEVESHSKKLINQQCQIIEFITPKDINDISWCVDNNIDCICISNVQSSKNLKAVKNIIGKNKNSISLIARIQSKEAVENIEEIIKESDGIQIARGYLTIHMPVEKLFVQQREMIKKCHEYMKPVLISCNILNSMVSSLLPSMSEIGEISNLVNEYVDGIILSSETSCSTNPVEAIKTLEKVCIEAENIRILDSIYKLNSSQQLRSAKTTIQSCIIECAIQTAFNINAKFIFAFTTRGYTALKISKMRPYCPILAITSDKRVARILTCVCGIQSLLIESLIGTEFIMKQIINIQKNEGKLFPGDFVVITYGDIEDKANQTNNIKVIIVE
ncbi:pyruvate kinase, putative [Ichthyophthirius multifiliis]|uniref:Pyruvate kinase n=1 Tax=Ichthyophthirius multifiliis TaxID=5932 RepID=G0QUU5_ICHMU|nr:pyruvate kinase, putative [Ichthyophthirius multifiliis]EGR31005.1 pyruvate kinase, putative [Ichthyophthirius multifiliis]|eukprot:XP_004034491.1 pyruvate kinase, putative [Ichthyophthirius multifiliis]